MGISTWLVLARMVRMAGWRLVAGGLAGGLVGWCSLGGWWLSFGCQPVTVCSNGLLVSGFLSW